MICETCPTELPWWVNSNRRFCDACRRKRHGHYPRPRTSVPTEPIRALLERRRAEYGTWAEVALELGASPRSILRVRRGEITHMHLATADRWAVALGTTLEAL